MRSPLVKIAVAAAILIVSLVLWRSFGDTGKTYALSDAPGIIRQARTIHVREFLAGGQGRSERWYDLENARTYMSHEGTYKVTYPSPETHKNAIATVRDGQYVMEVDHVARTARFERWLPCEQELHRLIVGDFALSAILPNVFGHLDRYTKIDKGEIDGQSYDIWRREWKDDKVHIGSRYDIWVSPSTGEIGRTRAWYKRYDSTQGWLLAGETEKIEINAEPPAGIFATEVPDGYVAKNSRVTAEITSAGFGRRGTLESGRLTVPASFALEDGSIVACWSVAGGPTEPDPNEAYRSLTFAGPVPDASLALYGFISDSFLETQKPYGSAWSWDENGPGTIVRGVGRHLVCTRRAGKVYEWALYVPQKQLPNPKLIKQTAMTLKVHSHDPHAWPTSFETDFLTSLVVTPERLARYLADAFRELSDDTTVPSYMGYQNLLNLAKQTRENRGLYEDFANEVRQDEERSIGDHLEPVKVTAPDEGK